MLPYRYNNCCEWFHHGQKPSRKWRHEGRHSAAIEAAEVQALAITPGDDRLSQRDDEPLCPPNPATKTQKMGEGCALGGMHAGASLLQAIEDSTCLAADHCVLDPDIKVIYTRDSLVSAFIAYCYSTDLCRAPAA
jgi:hypothetical protein